MEGGLKKCVTRKRAVSGDADGLDDAAVGEAQEELRGAVLGLRHLCAPPRGTAVTRCHQPTDDRASMQRTEREPQACV